MSAESIEKTRFTRWIEILKIAWPLIVANSFWNLQLTIDRIYLSNYSTESLAAALSVMGVFWVPMALLQQTAAYLMTFVAQYVGAKQEEKIGAAVWQSLYLSIGGGLLMLLLIPLSGPLFTWIGHSPNVRILETDYFVALCSSALPTALIGSASGFYTGLGRTQIIIWINCAGLVCNIILDYILIFGHFGFPAMGIAGAGYATSLSNWFAAFLGLWLLLKNEHELRYRVRSLWRFNFALMTRFIRYGLPSGLQWSLEGLAFTVFLIFIGRMNNGDAGLAASSIVVTVMLLGILPALGVAQAVLVLVGRYLGEKKPNEAEKCVWSGLEVAGAYIFVMGLSFALFPGFYLSWFQNSNDPALWNQVSRIVPLLFLYVAVFTNFDNMNLVFSFALKGAGDTRFVSLVALTLPWPIMVWPTWQMKDWDHALFWAWGAASLFIVSQALVFHRRFAGGKWKEMSVIN